MDLGIRVLTNLAGICSCKPDQRRVDALTEAESRLLLWLRVGPPFFGRFWSGAASPGLLDRYWHIENPKHVCVRTLFKLDLAKRLGELGLA
jgi:hypothetical protein